MLSYYAARAPEYDSVYLKPEPGTMLLLMIGCAALCWVGWRGGRGDSDRKREGESVRQ